MRNIPTLRIVNNLCGQSFRKPMAQTNFQLVKCRLAVNLHSSMSICWSCWKTIGLGSLNGSSCQSYSNEMFLGQMRRMGFNENTQIPNNAREMLLKQTVQRSLATLVTLRLCYGSFSFYAISLPHPACNFSALTCKWLSVTFNLKVLSDTNFGSS